MESNIYFDAIISNVTTTGQWRERQAKKFPSDKRNSAAAKHLSTLAEAKATDVDDGVWRQLAPQLDSASLMLAVNEATRDVGFRAFPKSINDLLLNIAHSVKVYA